MIHESKNVQSRVRAILLGLVRFVAFSVSATVQSDNTVVARERLKNVATIPGFQRARETVD